MQLCGGFDFVGVRHDEIGQVFEHVIGILNDLLDDLIQAVGTSLQVVQSSAQNVKLKDRL